MPKKPSRNTLRCIAIAIPDQPLRFFIMATAALILCLGALMIQGCSGSGSGGNIAVSDSNNNTDTDGYTGSAKVSGNIKLSSLSSSDSAQITNVTGSARAKGSKSVDAATEAVRLYVVGTDGELADTGISCTLTEDDNGDRSYECDGVKDGVNYIVRYVKLGENGTALEMKSNAFVPPGETAPTSSTDVTPASSVLVKALVDAILSATEGSGISDTVVNAIISSVKSAVQALITSGSVQIPSMVVKVADGTTLTDLVGTQTKNDNLDNTSGIILADDTIGTELGYVAAANSASTFDISAVTSDADKAALIQKVFKDLLKKDDGSSDDMPQFFFNFFTWLYVNNSTVKAGDLLNTLITSLVYSPSAINTSQVTVTNVLTMFNTKISQVNTLIAKDPATLTAEEKTILANTPGVLRGLFPASYPAVTSTTSLITPRAIALVIFFERVFMQQTVVPSTENLTATQDDGGAVSYSEGDYFRWSEHALFSFLGLGTYITSHPSEFVGIDVSGLYMHPGTIWIESTNTQSEALMLSCDINDLTTYTGVSDDHSLPGSSGATVTLTYPKRSGGTGTIALVYLTSQDGNWTYWGLDPWNEAYMANPGNPTINPARVVSDFTSGTYTVSVQYNGKTYSKSFTKKVISGMTNKYAKLTTPAGQPNWPGTNASQAEIDAFNTAWTLYNQNGGITNFTANVMDDGTAPGTGQTPTKAKITVAWKAPDVTLPDGVKMVYNIDIGRSSCDNSGNCTWTPVWNSWKNNTHIFATSFTVPYLFPIQTADDALNHPYDINVSITFIDKVTGEQLGSGGNAHSQFTVGEPIDPTKTFTLRGVNTINISSDTVAPSSLRAALIKEVYSGTTYTRTIVKIADIIGGTSYSLTFQIQDFLNQTTTTGTNYSLVLVEDPNDALSAGSSVGNTVITYWPDYSSSSLWFDTWGGILRVNQNFTDTSGNTTYVQKIITGDETIDGPKFFIGFNYYIAPDPTKVTPVPSPVLSQSFSISGNVNMTGLTNPVVVLFKEGYDSTIGYNVQTVISKGIVTAGTYYLTASVGDFYNADGSPTDKQYNLVLVEDTNPTSVIVGSAIANLSMYWPDWNSGTFGFDTWRGSQLYIYQNSYNSGTQVWTYSSIGVPGDSTAVTGPTLAKMY